MNEHYQEVPLGTLVHRRKEGVEIQDLNTYKRITIHMNGQGISVRDQVIGSSIGTKNQFLVRSGQFILSKIDARNGAFGITPLESDGAVITGNFWAFDVDYKRLSAQFFKYLTMTPLFIDFCVRASDGTTNRRYLQEEAFLAQKIKLPPLEEQRRIVARIEELAAKIEEARGLRSSVQKDIHSLLLVEYKNLTKNVRTLPMGEVAPLVRRPVQIDLSKQYPELGVRSFGKGTFHKPAIGGAELGTKKIFEIRENDLLFNIVFAWEGAVAVVQAKDDGRVGSHRFLTCVPKQNIATSTFLCFHFLTEKGLEQLFAASPGSAGRNRTLGIQALENLLVPLPPIEKQMWFTSLANKLQTMNPIHQQINTELDVLLPSILDKAFKGEL